MSMLKSMHRRDFLTGCATAIGAGVLAVTHAHAQDAPQPGSAAANNAPMDENTHRPVSLPPKSGARPLLTDKQRDELEHHLHCQCGCGHDVYTCRATDFSCSIAPAMHRDVMNLIAGGYTGSEIMAAFRDVYGERVLMVPTKEGFNWLAYILPFGVLAGGAVLVATLLKRWSRPAAAAVMPVAITTDATPEELARLRDAIRNEE